MKPYDLFDKDNEYIMTVPANSKEDAVSRHPLAVDAEPWSDSFASKQAKV